MLTPQEAASIVDRSLMLCPEITVVGVAGPGESLATSHALDALSLVHERHPELIGCLSTNGLLLAENIEQIVRSGVRTVTVTINAVDPVILSSICEAVVRDNTYLTGLLAAQTLISAQIDGLRKATEAGLVVKVNAVLIPGVNDEHTGEIARIAAAAGAIMMNIIPLIPQHKLSHIPAPDCDQLNRARESAEHYLPVFRHCKHCRADACGIPGINDLSDQLYDRQMETFSHG
jgi:nitrogen fixation protein NifB